jgi:hypothetical protein
MELTMDLKEVANVLLALENIKTSIDTIKNAFIAHQCTSPGGVWSQPNIEERLRKSEDATINRILTE